MKSMMRTTSSAAVVGRESGVVMRLTAWLLMGLAIFIWSSANADNHRQGPAFSDHTHVEAMPESWQRQPIGYHKLPPETDLAISLDQHLYPALLPLIKQYARQHDLRIAVEEGTCGISAGALLDKEVDIAGFCCPAGETDRLPGLTYHTLGIAALALVVHPDNPVTNVTTKLAQEIYMGKVGNWNALDPTFDKPIQTIARLHCKNRPGHWRLILDNEDQFSPSVREVSTIPDMLSLAGSELGSLGYETLWMAQLHADGGRVKTLAIDGVSPTDNAALLAARYPFYRNYNISSWSDPGLRKPHAEQLVAFIYQHFNEIDSKYGLISSERLRKAGWQFVGDELVAAPQGSGHRLR